MMGDASWAQLSASQSNHDLGKVLADSGKPETGFSGTAQT